MYYNTNSRVINSITIDVSTSGSADRLLLEIPHLRSRTHPVLMFRPWPNSGFVRLCRTVHRPLRLPHNRFSTVTCSLQSVAPDRVPLRKQLKQEAKTLKAQKRQRKESEEASRQEWELTVGVEIHAQLDTEAKLFSRMRAPSPGRRSVSLTRLLTRRANLLDRYPQFQCRSVRFGISG